MRIKHFLVLMLIMGVLFAFCACGSEPAAPATTQPTVASVEQTEPQPTEDGKVTYTVKVVDGEGAPLAGVAVQICKDSCLPGVTNAEGVATFRVVEAEGYKASFLTVPEGYTAEATDIYFESGSTELTLVLTAA